LIHGVWEYTRLIFPGDAPETTRTIVIAPDKRKAVNNLSFSIPVQG
jgi:hypothetical protein